MVITRSTVSVHRTQAPAVAAAVLYQKNSEFSPRKTDNRNKQPTGVMQGPARRKLLQEALQASTSLWLIFVSSTSSSRLPSLARGWVLYVHICLPTPQGRDLHGFIHSPSIQHLWTTHYNLDPGVAPEDSQGQILGKERAARGGNGCRSGRQRQGHRGV